MCESNLSYLMAYPRFLVLSICHWVNQDLWASSELQILIMVLQIKSDSQLFKGVCLCGLDGLIFLGMGVGVENVDSFPQTLNSLYLPPCVFPSKL